MANDSLSSLYKELLFGNEAVALLIITIKKLTNL